jgi:hypothetical protein
MGRSNIEEIGGGGARAGAKEDICGRVGVGAGAGGRRRGEWGWGEVEKMVHVTTR